MESEREKLFKNMAAWGQDAARQREREEEALAAMQMLTAHWKSVTDNVVESVLLEINTGFRFEKVPAELTAEVDNDTYVGSVARTNIHLSGIFGRDRDFFLALRGDGTVEFRERRSASSFSDTLASTTLDTITRDWLSNALAFALNNPQKL